MVSKRLALRPALSDPRSPTRTVRSNFVKVECTALDARTLVQMFAQKEVYMLPRLNADPSALVNVQETAFSHDVLGRWVCSTWPEVSGNGGDPFDVVVIGAGMFGGYF